MKVFPLSEEPKKLYYLSCPVCGKSVYLGVVTDATFENYSIDWTILQVRKVTGGRGRGGFYHLPEEGLNIKEMLKSAEFEDLARKIIGRLKLIYETWKEEGLLAEV